MCTFIRLALLISATCTVHSPFATSQVPTNSPVPQDLWGKWKVVKEFNTRTISCWGNDQAKKILGTTIEYGPNEITWRTLHAKVDRAAVKAISAEEFSKDNSSTSVSGSQIDFNQLKITAQIVKQVTIHHADAEITGATAEFPGDEVLLKTRDNLVFSLCNLYFEARRLPTN